MFINDDVPLLLVAAVLQLVTSFIRLFIASIHNMTPLLYCPPAYLRSYQQRIYESPYTRVNWLLACSLRWSAGVENFAPPSISHNLKNTAVKEHSKKASRIKIFLYTCSLCSIASIYIHSNR